MSASKSQALPQILQQHVEEAGFLWLLRASSVFDPHYSLSDLAHLDSRVEGHLDGLRIAGEPAWKLCCEALQSQEAGEAFAAAVLALESTDGEKLAQVLEIVSKSREAERGFVSALGWVTHEHSDKWVSGLLQATSPSRVRAAIAALAIRREDMTTEIEGALRSDDNPRKARALRAIGETKQRSMLPKLHEYFS